VGDPSLGQALATSTLPDLPGGPDYTADAQARFDAVARSVADTGYRVIRIPTVPSVDGKTFITYVNVIIDDRPDGRVVYLPQFRGADALNAAAADVWHSLGYSVRPVDCTSVYQFFGTLHCLVNVLDKSAIPTLSVASGIPSER
jgi:hypothetical protein